MIKKQRDDEIEGALDDEMELEIDEAVAASEDDGTIGRAALVNSHSSHCARLSSSPRWLRH